MVKNNVIIHPIAPPRGAARPAKLISGMHVMRWSMCPLSSRYPLQKFKNAGDRQAWCVTIDMMESVERSRHCEPPQQGDQFNMVGLDD